MTTVVNGGGDSGSGAASVLVALIFAALIGVGGWYFLSHGGITKFETINVTTPAPAAPAAPAPAAPSAPASDNN